MNIIDIVRLKYPGAIEDGLVTFVQHSTETGIEIGEWNIDGIERPTEADLLAESSMHEHDHNIYILKTIFNTALKKHFNAVAQERDYDDELKIMTYKGSSNSTWAAEAMAYSDWRDDVWEYAIAQLALFENNEREIVSEQDFINELPAMLWPE